MASCFIVSVFLLAFLYTLVCQFVNEQTLARLLRWDGGGLVPYYRVFDKPVRNLTLFYRTSPKGPWMQFYEQRTARSRHIFWNPEGHRSKLLWSHMRAISDCYHAGEAIHPYSYSSHGIYQILATETPYSGYCEFFVDEVGAVLFYATYKFGIFV